MTDLARIIIERMMKEGPLSFREFMEMALYYPDLGYYTSAGEKFGTKGDYYTSPNLTPLFGIMIGKQLEEMWYLLNQAPFTIVEYGAGTGMLCRAILSYLKGNDELYGQLKYCIIERSQAMCEKEKQLLPEKVTWHNSMADIGAVNGCILSNELLDNFPVHQVVMLDDIMEICVDYKNRFVEVLRPAPQVLKDYLAELNIVLPRGFRTEINLDAIMWIRDIAPMLKRGYILTIDYGFPSDELYQPYRRNGTLVCYNKHQVNDDPYKDIGEQDITAHVNFSALHNWGIKNGIECSGFTDQAHFLQALGFKEYLMKADSPQNFEKGLFLIKTLLMDMGSKYKVFIQQKNAPSQALSGLKPCMVFDENSLACNRSSYISRLQDAS